MNNFKGILLMLIAMAGFTMEDLFMKKLSVNLSTGQILITFGIGSSLAFALMAKIKGCAAHLGCRGVQLQRSNVGGCL